MFSINNNPCTVDDYSIVHMPDGYDTLKFTIHVDSPLLPEIQELAQVRERQDYLIAKAEGAKSIAVTCVLDLSEWKTSAVENFDNVSATLESTIINVLPAGWTFINSAGNTVFRTVKVAYGTPLDVVDACRKLYGVSFRFDNRAKTLTAVDSYVQTPAFITDQVNLRNLQYYGSGESIVTKLYVRGKDGLTFADINDGKDYIEDYTYTDKVIAGWWVDDRFTAAEELLAAAQVLLSSSCRPQRSYECDIIDIYKADNTKSNLKIELFDVVSVKDRARNKEHNEQVVQYEEYPHYPEKNVVTLGELPTTLSRKLQELETEINSISLSDVSTDWLTGDIGGYLYMVRNDAGQPTALVWMDALTRGEATRAMRIDQNGMSYNPNGPDSETVKKIIDLTNGCMINSDFINVDTLYVKHLDSADGSIGGFDISNGNLVGDEVALYPSGNLAGTLRLSGCELEGFAQGINCDGYFGVGGDFRAESAADIEGDLWLGARLYMGNPPSASSSANVRLVSTSSGYSLGIIGSSKRYKKNIHNINEFDEVGGRIDRVRAVTYESKYGLEKGNSYYGFIAEEMEQEFPWLVEYRRDKETGEIEAESVSYDRVPAILWADAQRTHDRLRELEERLAELEGLNDNN